MIDTILASVILAVGLGLLVYATIGRVYGFHHPIRWIGGGYVSFVGEISCVIFIICLGLAALQNSAIWCIPAPVAWLVGFISQGRANRQQAKEEETLRKRNSANYTGIFDNPPPYDIDRTDEDEFDLFDTGACNYIGKATKDDIKELIKQFGDIAEHRSNDIFLLLNPLKCYQKVRSVKNSRCFWRMLLKNAIFLH